MVRAPCCEKMGLKKGPWTQEEDQTLISYIQKHGHGNWRALPKLAGTSFISHLMLHFSSTSSFTTRKSLNRNQF